MSESASSSSNPRSGPSTSTPDNVLNGLRGQAERKVALRMFYGAADLFRDYQGPWANETAAEREKLAAEYEGRGRAAEEERRARAPGTDAPIPPAPVRPPVPHARAPHPQAPPAAVPTPRPVSTDRSAPKESASVLVQGGQVAFACRWCAETITFDSSQAGKLVSCPKCYCLVSVPKPSDSPPASAAGPIRKTGAASTVEPVHRPVRRVESPGATRTGPVIPPRATTEPSRRPGPSGAGPTAPGPVSQPVHPEKGHAPEHPDDPSRKQASPGQSPAAWWKSQKLIWVVAGFVIIGLAGLVLALLLHRPGKDHSSSAPLGADAEVAHRAFSAAMRVDGTPAFLEGYRQGYFWGIQDRARSHYQHGNFDDAAKMKIAGQEGFKPGTTPFQEFWTGYRAGYGKSRDSAKL